MTFSSSSIENIHSECLDGTERKKVDAKNRGDFTKI